MLNFISLNYCNENFINLFVFKLLIDNYLVGVSSVKKNEERTLFIFQTN